jgi:hypothetical protein
MVCQEGKYAGYTPIFQGDNAGPHQDSKFLNGVKEYCEQKGWHWQSQAAQMPRMNVLDLSVFQCMSTRHTDKSRESGGSKVLSEAEIWKNAESVWKELPNCMVASGYVQAYRIAEKVIKEKGDNRFLGAGGSIHTNVRTDFYETDSGLARKDKEQISAPGI